MKIAASLALGMAITLSQVPASSAQTINGFALDDRSVVGTTWTTTQSTPLWPYAQDTGFPRIRTLPRGARLNAVSAFGSYATGDYIQVRYRGSVGYVDARSIRRGFGNAGTGGGGGSTINVASGVAYTVVNVQNWASLRSNTSTQSQRITRVSRGGQVFTTGLQVQRSGYTWLSVRYRGMRGWMPKRYLSSFAPTNNGTGTAGTAYPEGKYSIVNVNNWASLRSRASRGSARITTVPRGDFVYHGGQRRRSGGEVWLRVSYQGMSGWMPVEYLALN
ncbi:MAG: SH3 domain-containing protein [Pseudomonadota bacterium]